MHLIDKKLIVVALFLDVSKAFDNLNHKSHYQNESIMVCMV